MTKLFIIISVVIAIVHGYDQYYDAYETHIDDYIRSNREHNTRALKLCDVEIKHFKNQHLLGLDTINMQLEMLIAAIDNLKKRINPYYLLNDEHKYCVDKYRYLIPSENTTKYSVENCISTARTEIENSLHQVISIRDGLEYYYRTSFEQGIKKCQVYQNLNLNHTNCVIDVVAATNAYTIEKRKEFENKLEVCKCAAKAHTKDSLDCSNTIEREMMCKIAEINFMVKSCFEGNNECKPCYKCLKSVNFDIGKDAKFIPNPIYKHTDNSSCLLFKITYH